MAKIKKVYQKGFTTVDNTVLNDESVSWKAKGLFTYLWSKPDNWTYSVKEVSKHAKDGRDSTSDGVQELEDHGYLKREQINEKGSFGNSVWTLSEKPIFKKKSKEKESEAPKPDNPLPEKPLTGNPSTDLPMTEKSSTENPALLNTDIPNTDITNNGLTKSSGSSAGAPTRESVFNQWQNDWGFPNSVAQQDLNEWLGKFGTEVVSYVIKYALTKNVTARGADRFLAKVFEAYEAQGVKTVEDAKQVNDEHDNRVDREAKQRRSRPKYGHKHIEEPLPDWAKKQGKPKKRPSKAFFDSLFDEEPEEEKS